MGGPLAIPDVGGPRTIPDMGGPLVIPDVGAIPDVGGPDIILEVGENEGALLFPTVGGVPPLEWCSATGECLDATEGGGCPNMCV